MNERPTAFVLVGLPGSGKSTWARNHPQKPPIASTDSFIEDFARKNNISYAEAFKKHYKQATKLLKNKVKELTEQKTNFIWDQTNLTRKERDKIYGILHKTHDVVFICFLVPLNICLERHEKRQKSERDGGDVVDAERIKELARMTVFPQKGDLCDKVVNIVHPEWNKGTEKTERIVGL